MSTYSSSGSSLPSSPLQSLRRNSPPTAPGSVAPQTNTVRMFRGLDRLQSETRALSRVTLPPLDYRETLRDVENALHDADMALRNAREAFRSSGMANRNSNNNHNNVVDLTNVSSDSSTEDSFMTQTRHPQDQNRGRSTIRAANSFNEPTFGPSGGSTTSRRSDPNAPAAPTLPSFRDYLESNFDDWPIPPPFLGSARQDANSQRLEETAAQQDVAERIQRSEAVPGVIDVAVPDQGQALPRRNSEASSSSISGLSEDSLGSESTDLDHDQSQVRDQEHPNMQAIDLTRVDDSNTLTAILAKEQQDAILQQNKNSDSTADLTALSSYKCAICMDCPTHATTTICGHLFCHRCIMDSLKWSEQLRRDQLGPGQRRATGLCPVCRKPLQNKEVSTTKNLSGGLVGLEIKKVPRKAWEANQKRKQYLETLSEKGKERQNSQTKAEDNDCVMTALPGFKDEAEDKTRIESLQKGSNKRKRGAEVARGSVSDDSLFGSP